MVWWMIVVGVVVAVLGFVAVIPGDPGRGDTWRFGGGQRCSRAGRVRQAGGYAAILVGPVVAVAGIAFGHSWPDRWIDIALMVVVVGYLVRLMYKQYRNESAVEARLVDDVRAERAKGRSWDDIGELFGRSGEDARKRFAHRL
ncbi:hypothetical protein [Mycobacterium hubeiense]|uniref:hypothetical protein n=1 Tax=Mycobacterium hubeiense TaxID=1867256 RepID=UPI000C7ED1B0|nr:hypothetical protein [Mycobacterium sp. QGD 101]